MMRGLMGPVLLLAMTAGPVLAGDPIRPAELPPAEFAGQQYVDTKGCMFVRAGSGGKVVWIPRVSREGVPICGNPPSGKRVPVAEEIGVQPVPEAGTTVQAEAGGDASAVRTEVGSGGYFVAVGSFGMAENANRAESRLTKLKYSVVKGRVQGATSSLVTVFAGPFPDAASAGAARDALRGDGFPDAIVVRP